MQILGKNLIFAVILFFFGFILLSCARKRVHTYLWVLLLLSYLALLAGILTQDLGASLTKHGLFNILLLVALAIPLLVYVLLWKLAFRLLGIKKGVILHILLVNILLGTIIYSKAQLKEDWPVGLFDQMLDFNSFGVQIPTNFTPWQSLQPRGWNFVLGQSCPDQHHFASLVDGVLSMECDPSQDQYFIEYPNFLTARDQVIADMVYVSNWASARQQWKNYTGPTAVNAEFLQAFCGDQQELFMQSVENETVLERLTPPTNTTVPHSPNILILFIDALSRAHFYRRLPETAKVLAEIQENEQASVYQFFKFHSLGPHTGPNTVPMYTGGTDLGWERERLQNPQLQFSFEENPLWWQAYNDSKYVRAWIPGFCENWPETYVEKPFPEGSMDHFMVMPYCHPDAFPLIDPFGPFNGPYSIKRRCIGDRKVHTYSLQYAKELFANYPSAGKIATVAFMEAHEGSMEVVAQIDDDLAEFLRSGLGAEFSNTFVFLVADHGNHMSPYYVWMDGGKKENKLPVLFIITPKWFKERYPTLSENLLANQNRLLTAQDLYVTLKELGTLPEFGGNATDAFKGLLEVLPNRGCEEAGIKDFMCVFEKYTLNIS